MNLIFLRRVGVLVPPLDASGWNLRRSLQIHCLLVCYRPLASLIFAAKKRASCANVSSAINGEHSDIATPSSSRAKTVIEAVPVALHSHPAHFQPQHAIAAKRAL